MADNKVVTLNQMNTVKDYIDAKDGDALKAVTYADNKIKFFKSKETSGSADVTIDLPKEMVLDLAKTQLVGNFTWDAATYPDTVNPTLDGQAVLVLAVKALGDPDTFSYSFIAIANILAAIAGEKSETATVTIEDNKVTVDVNISQESDNALVKKADGLFATGGTVKISQDENNALSQREDGLFAEFDPNASITYATNAEIEELFA